MKSHTIRTISAPFATTALALFAAALPAHAAVITQTVNNGGGVSWNNAVWGTPAAAPTSLNDYVTSSSTPVLRMGANTNSNPSTFLGGSLEIVTGSQGLIKPEGGASVTVNGNLTLNGGTIHHGPDGAAADNEAVTLVANNLIVTSASTIAIGAVSGSITISSTLTGAGNLFFTNSNANTGGQAADFVSISSVSGYTGAITLGARASGSVFGADNGVTVDFGSGDYTFANLFTILNGSILEVNDGQTLTFGEDSLLVGVNPVAPGTYSTGALGSSFAGAGTIVVIPEPSVAALGGLGFLVLLRRKRSR